MPFIPSARSAFLSLAALGALTGCYTQLATRGYGAVQAPALAERPADSLGAPPVIINHYYQPELAYRGHAHWEWDYPALTLGYYSSRFIRFSRPYWWDDPYYARRHSHGHSHPPRSHRDVDYRPAPGGGSAAPRLFIPDTDYPRPGKRRRSETAPVSAPPPSPSPVAKQGEDGSSSPSSSSSSSNPDQDYPRLKKGKRR